MGIITTMILAGLFALLTTKFNSFASPIGSHWQQRAHRHKYSILAIIWSGFFFVLLQKDLWGNIYRPTPYDIESSLSMWKFAVVACLMPCTVIDYFRRKRGL